MMTPSMFSNAPRSVIMTLSPVLNIFHSTIVKIATTGSTANFTIAGIKKCQVFIVSFQCL